MKKNMNNKNDVTHRELTLYLTGRASPPVRAAVEEGLSDPNSRVNAFLGWLGDPDKHRVVEPGDGRIELVEEIPSLPNGGISQEHAATPAGHEAGPLLEQIIFAPPSVTSERSARPLGSPRGATWPAALRLLPLAAAALVAAIGFWWMTRHRIAGKGSIDPNIQTAGPPQVIRREIDPGPDQPVIPPVEVKRQPDGPGRTLPSFDAALSSLLARLSDLNPDMARQARDQMLQDYPDHRDEIEGNAVLAGAVRPPLPPMENRHSPAATPLIDDPERDILTAAIANYPADKPINAKAPEVRDLWERIVRYRQQQPDGHPELAGFAERAAPSLDEQVRFAERRAGDLAEVPASAKSLLGLRRDVLRLRLDAFAQVSSSKPLTELLARTVPSESTSTGSELKMQVARIEEAVAKAARTTPIRQVRLLCVLPPAMRQASIGLYADVQKYVLAEGDKADPALVDFLLTTRRPGDQAGMIIPACFQLSDDAGRQRWQQLLTLGSSGVRIKVFINYGIETTASNPIYAEAFALAKANGIEVLGYITCDGGGKDLARAKEEVTRWHRLYPGLIRGIFFDNTAIKADGKLAYFADLFAYTRLLDRQGVIVSCPGTQQFDEACLTKTGADIMCRVSDGAELRPGGWEAKYDPSRFAAINPNVDNPTHIRNAIERALASHFGWIYVTDSMRLPTKSFGFLPSYLAEETIEMANLNEMMARGTNNTGSKKRSKK